MAIKSSGSLRLRYDIAQEIYTLTGPVSLNQMGDLIGDAGDTRMSEFYGYSSAPPNGFGWLGRDTYFRNALQQPSGTFSQGITLMAWVKPNYPTKKNQRLFAAGGSNRRARNEIRVHYISSLNRISVEVYDSVGVRRIRREYPLHSGGNNASITGVTNSTTGWCRNQVGNVDPTTGLAHITATWEGAVNTAGSYTGLKLFWRGVELTYSVNNNSSSTLATSFGNYIAVRNHVGSGASSSTFDGYTDNFGVFLRALTPAEVTTVFSKGNINVENAVQSSGIDIAELAYYQGFEQNLTNEQGGATGYTLALNGSNGAYFAYP